MQCVFGNFVAGPGAVSLLVLRAIWGVAMVLHGWPKMHNPFGWMDVSAPSGVPSIFQALAAVAECGGGLAVCLGFLTPIATSGILCAMAVATFMHMVIRGDPFVSSGTGSSYEQALVYASIALVLMLVGPGKLSLDWRLFGRKHSAASAR
jgi:putative oxidoreductase